MQHQSAVVVGKGALQFQLNGLRQWMGLPEPRAPDDSRSRYRLRGFSALWGEDGSDPDGEARGALPRAARRKAKRWWR